MRKYMDTSKSKGADDTNSSTNLPTQRDKPKEENWQTAKAKY